MIKCKVWSENIQISKFVLQLCSFSGKQQGATGVRKVTWNSSHLPLSTRRQLALENAHSFSANTNTSCVFSHRNTFFWLDIKSVYTHTCFKMFFSQIPHITQEMGDKKKLLYICYFSILKSLEDVSVCRIYNTAQCSTVKGQRAQ